MDKSWGETYDYNNTNTDTKNFKQTEVYSEAIENVETFLAVNSKMMKHRFPLCVNEMYGELNSCPLTDSCWYYFCLVNIVNKPRILLLTCIPWQISLRMKDWFRKYTAFRKYINIRTMPVHWCEYVFVLVNWVYRIRGNIQDLTKGRNTSVSFWAFVLYFLYTE